MKGKDEARPLVRIDALHLLIGDQVENRSKTAAPEVLFWNKWSY